MGYQFVSLILTLSPQWIIPLSLFPTRKLRDSESKKGRGDHICSLVQTFVKCLLWLGTFWAPKTHLWQKFRRPCALTVTLMGRQTSVAYIQGITVVLGAVPYVFPSLSFQKGIAHGTTSRMKFAFTGLSFCMAGQGHGSVREGLTWQTWGFGFQFQNSCSFVNMQSQCKGGGDRWGSGPPWPDSLSYLGVPDPWNPLKPMWWTPEEKHKKLTSAYTPTHTPTSTPVYTLETVHSCSHAVQMEVPSPFWPRPQVRTPEMLRERETAPLKREKSKYYEWVRVTDL